MAKTSKKILMRRLYELKIKDPKYKQSEEYKKKLNSSRRNYQSIKNQTKRQQNFTRKKWRKQKSKRKNKQTNNSMMSSQRQFGMKVRRNNFLIRKEIENKQKQVNFLIKQVRNLKQENKRLSKMDNIVGSRQIQSLVLMSEAIKDNIKRGKQMDKQMIVKNISSSEIESKNLMLTTAKTLQINVKTLKKHFIATSIRCYYRKKRNELNTKRINNLVSEFYLRDDVSRPTTTTKATIISKIKYPKRFLNDSMINLFEKFNSENPNVKIGYDLFTKLKPKYVLTPRIKDREECLCKIHENFHLLSSKIKNLKLIPTTDPNASLKSVLCEEAKQNCYFNLCSDCNVNYNFEANSIDHMSDKIAKICQWQAVVEDKIRREKKVVKSLNVNQLIEMFNLQLKAISQHQFKIVNQFKKSHQLKELSSEDAVLHIDFSQNYNLKVNKEIQAAAFGASKQQISIHTGMLYVKPEENLVKIPFASVSPILSHNATSIWTLLLEPLNYIKTNYPNIKNLHFLSDSPLSQYRNRFNLYYLSKIPFLMGFKSSSWNFFEVSHGKGAPDGVGSLLKRTADRAVSCGQDIDTFEKFLNCIIIGCPSVLIFKELELENHLFKLFPELNISKVAAVPCIIKCHCVISKERHKLNIRICLTCVMKNAIVYLKICLSIKLNFSMLI